MYHPQGQFTYMHASFDLHIPRQDDQRAKQALFTLQQRRSNSQSYLKNADQKDQLLPTANVGRIMKQILPPNAKLSKEAKQIMQESATEFISFITAEAAEKCRKENRKTLNGDDICRALSSLGFDNYAEVIARYLYNYRVYAERERANNQNKGNNNTGGQESDVKCSEHDN